MNLVRRKYKCRQGRCIIRKHLIILLRAEDLSFAGLPDGPFAPKFNDVGVLWKPFGFEKSASHPSAFQASFYCLKVDAKLAQKNKNFDFSHSSYRVQYITK